MRLFLAFFAVTFVPAVLQWIGAISFWASWGMTAGFIVLILWLNRKPQAIEDDDEEDNAVCMDHD